MKQRDISSIADDAGFTLMELLIATALTSVIAMMTIGHVLVVRNGYFDDIVRTRINSNLRSALDILSMNIRQAGENLQSGFPVIEVEDGEDGLSDSLTLRRNLIQEVLTVCSDANTGENIIYVSSLTLTDPECTAGNVTSLYNVFANYRTTNGNSVRAFIYNQITGQSEFVDYTGEGSASGEYYINTSALTGDYPALTSNVYLIEQYAFTRNTAEDTLQLVIDAQDDQPQTVAFSVSDFSVALEMEDGSELTEFNSESSASWRDILQVRVVLSGEEERKDRVISSSIQGEYFPRNVLSY